MGSRQTKDCESKDTADPTPAPPAKKITPVRKRIGEGDKNLKQRSAWFERRTSKDDSTS
jgi:hypothetical protein